MSEHAETDLARRLFAAVVRATCPDDPCGHLPNCGYSAEHQTCGCSEWGRRLHEAITNCITPAAESEAHDPVVGPGRVVCLCGDFNCASLTTLCAVRYGHNPDLCNRESGHAGPHNNRYGTTWAAR